MDTVRVDKEFQERASQWTRQLNMADDRTQPLERQKVRQLVEQLYQSSRLSGTPKIVFCQSPLQMILMPVLFVTGAGLDEEFEARFPEPLLGQIESDLKRQIGDEVTGNLFSAYTSQFDQRDQPGEFCWFGVSGEGKRGLLTTREAARLQSCFSPEDYVKSYTTIRRTEPGRRRSSVHDIMLSYLRRLHEPVSVHRFPFVPSEDWRLHGEFAAQLFARLKVNLPNDLKYLEGFSALYRGSERFLVSYINECHEAELKTREQASALMDVMDEAHMIYPFRNICFVCEYPDSLVVDGHNRFHCADGPAISYGDDLKLYFWNGVRVEPNVIEERDALTPEIIFAEPNLEIRRSMLEVYGPQRFLLDNGIDPVQRDQFGELYKFNFDNQFAADIVMVKVSNKTVEDDGTRKEYWIRVPPHIETAREAVAWSFRMDGDKYNPIEES